MALITPFLSAIIAIQEPDSDTTLADVSTHQKQPISWRRRRVQSPSRLRYKKTSRPRQNNHSSSESERLDINFTYIIITSYSFDDRGHR